MPDLLTHSGLHYLIHRPVSRKGLFWFMAGGILPDLGLVFNALSHYGLIPQLNLETSLLLLQIHTPWSAIWISATIAIMAKKPRMVFGRLLSGAMLHMALDSLQRAPSGRITWLFPFSFHISSLDLFDYGGAFFNILLAIGIIATIVYLWRERIDPLGDLVISGPRAGAAFGVLTGYILISIAIYPVSLAAGFGGVDIILHPEKHEGRTVQLAYVHVVNNRPLTVKKRDFKVILTGTEKFPASRNIRTGDTISVIGVLGRGTLSLSRFKRVTKEKPLFSALGLIALAAWAIAGSMRAAAGRRKHQAPMAKMQA